MILFAPLCSGSSGNCTYIGTRSEGILVDAGATSRRMADMSKEIYGRCRGMLEQNYDKVERLAKRLLEDETLAGNAIESLMEGA